MNFNNSISFPQLKLSNNTKSWNKVKLNEVLTERNIKDEKGKNYEHVSLTQDGIIPKSSRYERDFLVTNENKKYKITKFNDICYNPANLKFGVICRNNYKDAIFSPIYITFEANNDVLPQFIEQIVTNKKFINEALQFQQGTVFERMSVSPEDLLSININIPDIDTQKRIVTILENINNKIILEEKSINKLKNVKKALLELMFPQENTYAPKLRFKEFNEDWEDSKLGELVIKVNRKNINNESNLPLTISAQYGLIDQITYFKNRVASKNISNYYLILKGEFAYNKSSSDGFPYGTIKRLDLYDKGVLSTLYIVFAIKDFQKIDSDFLNVFFDTDKWYKDICERATEGARHHGLLNISAEDFFETSLLIPNSILEQKTISSLFNTFNSVLSLHEVPIKLTFTYIEH